MLVLLVKTSQEGIWSGSIKVVEINAIEGVLFLVLNFWPFKLLSRYDEEKVSSRLIIKPLIHFKDITVVLRVVECPHHLLLVESRGYHCQLIVTFTKPCPHKQLGDVPFTLKVFDTTANQ